MLDAYPCFIQTHECETGCTQSWQRSEGLDQSIQLRFQDKAAIEAGSVLYGGILDPCGVCGGYVTGKAALNTWANIPSNLTSSGPYQVCICVDNHPDDP